MTHRTFVISDTHFGHSNILNFTRDDGSPVRPFASVEEMNECMVERWNAVVRPIDKVYHLGDAVIQRRAMPTLKRLNGKKRLVRGNHDIFKTAEYLEAFEEVYGVRVLPKLDVILSHIPIHPDSLSRWRFNVHGHLHHNRIGDPRYINVSVEQIDYTPADLERLIAERDGA